MDVFENFKKILIFQYSIDSVRKFILDFHFR